MVTLILAIVAFVTTIFALAMWHINTLLIGLINDMDKDEKEEENPNQLKLEFDEENID